MLRTGVRAASPRAFLPRSRARIAATANRLAHTYASSTSSASSSRIGVIAGITAVVGYYGLIISTRDRLYMEDQARAVEKAPPVIETKASEFQEAVADEHSPSDSPDASDSESPSKSEGEQHEDAGSAAFNPETGEINWDCPCLGGMAHGPCGEEFRTAFSCFVYSEGEPKGIECVEKFKGMQDCFRAHPEHYGAEIDDDDEEQESSAEAMTPGEAVSDLPEGSSAPVEATLSTEEPPSAATPEPAKPKPKRKAKAKAESIPTEAAAAEGA